MIPLSIHLSFLVPQKVTCWLTLNWNKKYHSKTLSNLNPFLLIWKLALLAKFWSGPGLTKKNPASVFWQAKLNFYSWEKKVKCQSTLPNHVKWKRVRKHQYSSCNFEITTCVSYIKIDFVCKRRLEKKFVFFSNKEIYQKKSSTKVFFSL